MNRCGVVCAVWVSHSPASPARALSPVHARASWRKFITIMVVEISISLCRRSFFLVRAFAFQSTVATICTNLRRQTDLM